MSARTPTHRTIPPTQAHPGASPRPAQRLLATLLLGTALLAAGCTIPIQAARMALPPTLESAPAARFEGLGGGRSGGFTLEGEAVAFRRMGDALSLFDRLRLDRVAVEFTRGAHRGRCDGRAATGTAGVVQAPVQPLELSCRFSGPVEGELVLREARLAAAGTRQAREGQARLGSVVLDVRSEHALAGTPLPLAQPAGYRMMIQGRDVAALDLAGGTPVLRRVAGLDAATQQAVTQVALALGLLFDPAVTLG